MRNQITALWDGPVLLGVRGSDSPFVFAWVDDVAGAMAHAATGGPAGIYNVAGDGRMTVREIAARLGKPVLNVPAGLLALGGLSGLVSHASVLHLYAAAILILPLALAEYWSSALRAQGSVWIGLAPRDIVWRMALPLAVVAFLLVNAGVRPS